MVSKPLMVRVTEEWVELIDKVRGATSRAAWIRSCIMDRLNEAAAAPLVSVEPPLPTPRLAPQKRCNHPMYLKRADGTCSHIDCR